MRVTHNMAPTVILINNNILIAADTEIWNSLQSAAIYFTNLVSFATSLQYIHAF